MRNSHINKYLLLILGSIIFSISIFYTNFIVKKISNEERGKAMLWAHAIRKKASLIKYTEELFLEIEEEERRKGELWASGMRRLININDPNTDLSFVFEVVKNNKTVPVILTDENNKVLSVRNLDPAFENDSEYIQQQLEQMRSNHPPIEIKIFNRTKNYLYFKESRIYSELRSVMNDLIRAFITEEIINNASIPVIYTDSSRAYILEYGNVNFNTNDKEKELRMVLEDMKSEHPPIRIDLPDGLVNYMFYKDSDLVMQLKYYPYIQMLAIIVFFVLAYVLFNTSKHSEQNKVWVGMSKETAHQLGTPISSLIAWNEMFRYKYPDEIAVPEIDKDIARLKVITDRFSKIGSEPTFEKVEFAQVLEQAVDYLKVRVSKKVAFELNFDEHVHDMLVQINKPLVEWVIENLTKNAVDAMEGNGMITYNVSCLENQLILDISDTGKGIPKSSFKKVFRPGYSTKKRGWGLGLALVKRIIGEYHKGKIFVKESVEGEGTTFRIILNTEF